MAPSRVATLGALELAPNEMVTFVTEAGQRFDFTRKEWGYYATPSVNKRLKQEGFKTALVRNQLGQIYVMVVAADRLPQVEQYCRDEQQAVLEWLDERLPQTADRTCSLCGSQDSELTFRYDEPPAGETRFALFETQRYYREIWRCRGCGLFVNHMDVALDTLYAGQYVDATYGADGLRQNFQRIMALPPEKSDNTQRVRRITAFMAAWQRGRSTAGQTLLDVGSGLAVFPARMREAGWDCTALDPDPRAADHARQVAGVAAVTGDFMTATDLGRFDLITFNKVLEHVPEPVTMLARSATFLKPDGIVYVEVPDGEAAASEGPGREEFFIEHRWVFSAAAVSLLAQRAGFQLLELERLREPSTKFTLRAFLRLPAMPAN